MISGTMVGAETKPVGNRDCVDLTETKVLRSCKPENKRGGVRTDKVVG